MLTVAEPRLWTPEKLRHHMARQRSTTVRDSYGNVNAYRPLGESITQEIENFLMVHRLAALNARGIVALGGAAPTAWTFTNNSRTYMLNGTFDWDTDSFKMALHDTGSNIGAATTTWAGVTSEEGNAGYTAGGAALTIALSGTTTVTVDETTNPSWTASGADLVCRYAVVYEVAGNVGCYCELESGSSVTATTGNTLTVTIHATNGLFQLA